PVVSLGDAGRESKDGTGEQGRTDRGLVKAHEHTSVDIMRYATCSPIHLQNNCGIVAETSVGFPPCFVRPAPEVWPAGRQITQRLRYRKGRVTTTGSSKAPPCRHRYAAGSSNAACCSSC